MAKMFYTLEEVAQKLGKSQDEVKQMADRGEIQVFRDRDKLMFKVEQIDLLAGGDDDDAPSEIGIGLDESSGASGIDLKGEGKADQSSSQSGSGIELTDSAEESGISVFDSSHGDEEDGDAEKTHVGETVEEELSLESVGSGSGLLDLTRESDDTTLGALAMESAMESEDEIELPAGASGLFESAGAESPGNVTPVGGSMPMMIESYDGGWSGFGVGAMIGAAAALICVALVTVVAIMGSTPGMATQFTQSDMMFWGLPAGLLIITLIFGLIGFFIGRATE